MINEPVLGAFIMDTFMPFVPFMAGGIASIILLLLVLTMFRGFLPEDKFK